MVGVYFSGTGNSRYVLERFCQRYDSGTMVFSIEDDNALEALRNEELIAFAYPVQYSTVPKIVREYIAKNKDIWKDKKIFVIATMGLFSGDGAGMLGRELKKYGAIVTGGLHVKMPDSIGDVKLLKYPLEKNKITISKAVEKIDKSADLLKEGSPKKEGIGVFAFLAGFFGQRLYFGHMTKEYSDKLKINKDKCIGCGKCEKICPMKNISLKDGKAVADKRCTMCYRCINNCPKQAITLLGKTVVDQSVIEKYL